MALRDQPYIPLYVQDLLTDEKLIECSASAHGVYLRIICILHKQEEYGVILLKQKDKQTDNQIKNFALKLAKPLPFDLITIETSILELINEKVLHIEEDKIIQKRMQKDGLISDTRSKSGSQGGKKTQSKLKNNTHFDKAKVEAKLKQNTEYEYEIEDVSNDLINKKTELLNLLCEKYGYQENRFYAKKRIVLAFINTTIKSEMDYDFFIKNFNAYNDYKTKSEEIPHGFDGLFGTQSEQFQDGALCKENWIIKLESIKPTKSTKFSRTAEAYNGAKNPYEN